jgi:hypothetical protein
MPDRAARAVLKTVAVAASLGLQLASTVASAQTDCEPVLPEVTEELAHRALPSNTTRWAAAERLWRDNRDSAKVNIQKLLDSHGISPTADTIEKTRLLLQEAIVREHHELVGELLRIWEMPLDRLVVTQRFPVPSPGGPEHAPQVELDRPMRLWLTPQGTEAILYSAIYLAGATEIAKTAVRSRRQISPALRSFVRRTSELAVDTYRRWALGPPRSWTVRGWGCGAGTFSLLEITRLRLEGSLGNAKVPYCQAPTDLDMLIAIGIANLLVLADSGSAALELDSADRETLLEAGKLLGRLVKERLQWTTTVTSEGKAVQAADLDPGVWKSHPDWRYAGDESLEFPRSSVAEKEGVSWDFAHAHRLGWMFLALSESASFAASGDWRSAAEGIAHQVASRVLDESAQLPRFRNYMDGSNGWFRVNTNGPGTGIPPFGHSRAFLAGTWPRLAYLSPRLLSAMSAIWKALAGASPGHCDLVRDTYVQGQYWRDFRPATVPLSPPPYSLDLLPLVITDLPSDANPPFRTKTSP